MRRAAFVLLLLVLAPVLAAAQESTPVLVEDLDAAYDPRLATGTDPVELRWRLLNIDSNTRYFLRVTVRPVAGWDASVDTTGVFLEPLAERNVTVRLEPGARVPDRAETVVTFALVDSDTGVATTVQRSVTLIATESALVLGVFTNPLPPPLDNVYGVFALDVLFWVVVGLAAVLVGDSVVRMAAARVPHETLRLMLQKLRSSVFLLVVAVGLERSFRIVPESSGDLAWLAALLKIAVIALAAFVGYRVLSVALDYYSATVAQRTETKIDDVLIPVLRKVAAVVVIVLAIGFVFDLFGIDATVIFGAAGIAGLVIAFAAQDTLANFFSGVFLLVDRPFLEGDDVQIETGEVCRVENIGLRSTRLYHYRNHEVIVLPNNQLASRKVVNLAAPDRRYRMFVSVGVAYGSDVPKVKAALESAARSHPDVVADGENAPGVLLDRFGESSVDFLLVFLVKDVKDRGRVASEVRQAVLKSFAESGIEIPFPHRTLIVQGRAPDLDA